MSDEMNFDEMAPKLTALFGKWPAMWWDIFNGCLEKGFTDKQAMELLKTYILSQGSNGTKT